MANLRWPWRNRLISAICVALLLAASSVSLHDLSLRGGWLVVVAAGIGLGPAAGALSPRWRALGAWLVYAAAVCAVHVSSWAPFSGLLDVSALSAGFWTPWSPLRWLGPAVLLVAGFALLTAHPAGLAHPAVPAVTSAAATAFQTWQPLRALLASRSGAAGSALPPLAASAARAVLDMAALMVLGRLGADRVTAEQVKNRTFADLQAAHAALRDRAQEAEELAALRERSRLARELHDTLGHALSAITVQAEAARRTARADAGRIDPLLVEVQDTARVAMADLRRHLAALREPAAPQDLAAAVRSLAEGAARRNGWRLDLDIAADLTLERRPQPRGGAGPGAGGGGGAAAGRGAGPEAAEAALGRAGAGAASGPADALLQVAREALTNVERHAGARRVAVVLRAGPDGVRLVVEDDGRGFAARPGPGAHLGLQGMRERVAEGRGTLDVESAPGHGTRITAVLPGGAPAGGGDSGGGTG